MGGSEPPTCGLGVRRSNHLSYITVVWYPQVLAGVRIFLVGLVSVKVVAEHDIAVIFVPNLLKNRLFRRPPEQYMVQN